MIYWLLITGWILASSSYIGKILQPYVDKQKLVKDPAEKGPVMLGLGFWRFSLVVGVLTFGSIMGIFFLVWLRTKIDFAQAMTIIFAAAWGSFLFGTLFWWALKLQSKKLSVQLTGQILTMQNQIPKPPYQVPKPPILSNQTPIPPSQQNQSLNPANTIIVQPNYKPLVTGLVGAALILGGYYFISEIIRQQSAADLQAKQIQDTSDARHQRDVNIYNCLSNAQENSASYWAKTCKTSGVDNKGPNCLLPSSSADRVTASRLVARDECYKRYPEIK